MEIQNEVTEKPAKEKPAHVVVKNTADYQRMKLEKLMKNPDKPVIIPERPKERGSPHVPDFVRNVMGSSAGAGSGEFHVYRHLRRKEYARQKYMQERAAKEREDEAYKKKLEENKKLADERTAKKRAKRLKKKKKQKSASKKPKLTKESSSESEDSSDDDSTAYGEHETSQDDEKYSGTENERNKIPEVSETTISGKALHMNSAIESEDNQSSKISDAPVNEMCAQKPLENENRTGESQDVEMSSEKSPSESDGHIIDKNKNE